MYMGVGTCILGSWDLCTWELGPVYMGVGTCVLGSWDLCDRNLHKKMKEMLYCSHNNTYFGNVIDHDYIWPF